MIDGSSSVSPVIAGLAVGLALVVLFSALSELPRLPIEVLYPPEVGKTAEKAIRIALRNDTLQQMFAAKDMVVQSVIDYGVSSTRYDCRVNSCAVIVFAERPGINTPSVAVLVSTQPEKVYDITPSKSWQ